MRRRELLSLPAVAGVAGLMPGAAAAQPAAPVRCAHPGLGRGFHLGEVFGRTAADFADMAAAGCSLVRLGIALQPDTLGLQYQMSPQAMPELLRQLELARSHRMRLVLVLRPAPEPEAPLWASAPLQSSLVALWRDLARRLAGRNEVAAFDLVNEPHPPGLTFGLKQQRWDALATRLVQAVRAEDPQRVIVLEPSPGARPMAFATATRLPFDRLVYSVHMYEPFEFTHQRVGDPRFTGTVGYPGPVPGQGNWDRDRLQAELAPVKRFADRHGVEIYVGEFGAPRWAPGASRARYLGDLLSIFADWQWSWSYHAWREWHGWDAEMAASTGAEAGASERRAGEPVAQRLRAAMQDCGATGGTR